jgi:hypothetical protein
MQDKGSSERLIGVLHEAIDVWVKAVQENTFDRLLEKPSENSWSLGQLCNHLLESTDYFFEQVILCLSNNENAGEEMSPDAQIMFRNNEFPNIAIEGPPSNASTPQPNSKEGLLHSLTELRQRLNTIEAKFSNSRCKGKTRHPGLKYFNAGQWLKFAEMHFRHHLRQKKKIDDFLNKPAV